MTFTKRKSKKETKYMIRQLKKDPNASGESKGVTSPAFENFVFEHQTGKKHLFRAF
jgi:hypothetical protein